MKKGGMWLVAAVILGLLAVSFYKREKVTLAEVKPVVETVAVKESFFEKSNSLDKNETVEIERVDFAEARNQAPTFMELEHEYSNYRKEDLEKELTASKKLIEQLSLVAKANAGQLAAEEAKILITEMRKQGVLVQLQLKEKLQAAKRKYL